MSEEKRSSFDSILPGKSTTFGEKDFLDDHIRNFGPKITVVNHTKRVLNMSGIASGVHGFEEGTMDETWCLAHELVINVHEIPELKIPWWKRLLSWRARAR